MKIFRLEQDFSKYNYYLVSKPDNFHEVLGKRTNDEEIDICVSLFAGRTRKERSRKNNFNISVFSNDIFVSRELLEILKKVVFSIESIQVNTDDLRDFFYLNPILEIDILDVKNNNEILEMVRSEKYKLKNNVDLLGKYIFRDKITSIIFVTEEFFEKFHDKCFGCIFIEV